MDLKEPVSLIALVALVFAGLQWYTNHKRYKHELFDRRYRVYIAITDFLSSLGAHGRMRQEDQMEFLTGTAGARFIFSPLEEKYIHRIHKIGLDLNLASEEERHRDSYDITRQIRDELSNVERVFDKYLRLR